MTKAIRIRNYGSDGEGGKMRFEDREIGKGKS